MSSSISSSDEPSAGGEPRLTTRGFFWKLGLALAPAALYVAICTSMPLWAGEFTPLTSIARLQEGGKVYLYGRAYRDNYFAFKLLATQEREPALIALGSSRVMQFRAPGLESCFYNAGGAAQAMNEVGAFLSRLPPSTPRVVVVSLDQPWFNADAGGPLTARRAVAQLDDEENIGLYRALNLSRVFFFDLLRGRIHVDRLLARRDHVTRLPARGLSAIQHGRGFRPDGSYQYGNLLQAMPPIQERLAEGWQSYRDARGHFAPGSQISGSALALLDSVLAQAHAKGYTVVGFTPPYAPSIYRAMIDDGRHQYLTALPAALRAVFARHEFFYEDFSDPSAIGGTDEAMYDAHHGSSELYGRLREKLADGDRSLRALLAACDTAVARKRVGHHRQASSRELGRRP